ncbi:hypothetical protein AMECASPLE_037082 [Ameca splendens]|uniref:Uncharacterized protein n=1 Tax=Ameca splendens TaxID=208324 RepID=A0ABV0XKU9_9TELE
MRVGMCDCDCVCLFFVLGWVLDCSLSWISLATLPAGGWCLCPLVYLCSRCPGWGTLVCAGSLPMVACQGLDDWPLLGHCLGNDMSWSFGSLGPWLDLLVRRRLPVGPVGSSMQLPGTSELWLLGGSPGTPPCSSLGGRRSPGVPVLWGPLDVYGSDLLHICPRSRGAGLWLLTLPVAYF